MRTSAARPSAQVGLLGVGAMVLTGCVSVPTVLPASTTPAAKPAAKPAVEAALLQDYDRRNNAAIAALSKRYDKDVWEGVDSAPVLVGDRFSSALENAKGKKAQPGTLTHRSK